MFINNVTKTYRLPRLLSVFGLLLCATMIITGGFGCAGQRALPLIEDRNATAVVVIDQSSAPARFAAKELVTIINDSTGVELDVVDVASTAAEQAETRILIGRNALVRQKLGEKLLDSLKKQESLVTSRGNDLILVGGDDWGTLYAVYDFLENEAGYRNFLPAPGGERFVETDTLIFSGQETRREMAFKGYRDGHPRRWPGMDADAAAKFFFRNRMNLIESLSLNSDFALDSGLEEEFRFKGHNHGFGMFFDWDETFMEHPEYYTLNKDGERIDNAQMCLSNPAARAFLTEKVLTAIAEQRPQGINCFVVASNDFQGSRYCWCPDCLALEEKYNSTGGPLWDYLLEFCDIVDEKYPDVYISSLAYKGPGQTEKAPDNIVFPDNFIADCAFLNSMLTLKEIPAQTLEDGERFQKFENLLKWNQITEHVSYWFYGHATGPTTIYERPAKELRELQKAGVESIFVCNFGGEQQFGPVSRYVTLRLMIDPHQNSKQLAAEAARFLYGDAADMMMAHMAEMEELRLTPGLSPVAQNPFPAFTMLESEQILRWRQEFDTMEELTNDDPQANYFVRVARTATDIWTLIFLRKIQEKFPDFNPDIQALVDKGLATCDEMKERKLEPRDNKVRRAFESLQLFAYLKDDSLPAELSSVPRDKVIRHLPAKAGKKIVLYADPNAVTGYAIRTPVPEKNDYADGVRFELYDALNKEWLLQGQNAKIAAEEIVPGEYKLYRVGTERLAKSSRFVVGNLWGTGVDIDSLSTYYNMENHNRHYEIWMSLKFEGPKFNPDSQARNSYISWDQIFIVDKGIIE